MSDGREEQQKSITVQEFSQASDLGLDLEVLNMGAVENEIASPRIQKLGLALAGFTGYLHRDRVQILGGTEINYLQALDSKARSEAVQGLRDMGVCCIVVTRGLEVPLELHQLAVSASIPLLRTTELSSTSISRISHYLEKRLSPRMTVHGVLLDLYGLGVLLLGPSGIGKSECGLELVLKGHRMVADDYVEITRQGENRLSGTGGPVLKHHMELRGLGIINIKELFGVSATGVEQTIDLVVRLERWNPNAEYDRLGLDQSSIDFLDVSLPLVDMPVAPGRNIAILVEVAARVHLLRQRGFRPSQELQGDGFKEKSKSEGS